VREMGYNSRDIRWSENMSIDPKLLQILACPSCKTEVKLTEDEKGLKCIKCSRVYPIRDDIPVMLIDEASVEPERATKD
jgi:uncharacterized protein YbaR (Trm112 family)